MRHPTDRYFAGVTRFLFVSFLVINFIYLFVHFLRFKYYHTSTGSVISQSQKRPKQYVCHQTVALTLLACACSCLDFDNSVIRPFCSLTICKKKNINMFLRYREIPCENISLFRIYKDCYITSLLLTYKSKVHRTRTSLAHIISKYKYG